MPRPTGSKQSDVPPRATHRRSPAMGQIYPPAARTAAPPLSSAPTVGRRRRVKDLVAVNIGNAIEWFDWNVYAIFAPFFAVQFFRDRKSTRLNSSHQKI